MIHQNFLCRKNRELWALHYSFINLIEWSEGQVLRLQLIGDIKHTLNIILILDVYCWGFSRALEILVKQRKLYDGSC